MGRVLQNENDCDCGACTTEDTLDENKYVRIAGWKGLERQLEDTAKKMKEVGYEDYTFEIVKLDTLQDLINEVSLDARLKTDLYDGFVLPVSAMGELFDLRGLEILDDYLEDNEEVTENVFPQYKEMMSFGSNKFMVPIAGSQMLLYFNKTLVGRDDILNETYTWESYLSFLDNLQIGNDTVASCTSLKHMGRCDHCQLDSLTHAIWASMTQGQGSTGLAGGGMFLTNGDPGWEAPSETVELQPIFDAPFIKAMKILDDLVNIHPAVLDKDTKELVDEMFLEGKCATIITSARYLISENATFSDDIGVTVLPGSTTIYNPKTKELETCTKKTCRGDYFTKGESKQELVNQIHLPAYSFIFYGGISSGPQTEGKKDATFQFLKELSINGNFLYDSVRPTSDGAELTGREEVFNKLTRKDGNGVVNLRIPDTQQMFDELLPTIYDSLKSEDSTNYTELSEKLSDSWEKIFEVNNAQERVNMTVYHKKSQNTYEPTKLSRNTISDGYRYGLWSLAGLGMIIALYFAYWSYAERKNKVVRASQPIFLGMISVGVFIMLSTIIPIGMDESFYGLDEDQLGYACAISPWLFSVGFVISFSALFSKTWRVNKILNNPDKFRRLKVTYRDVIAPFVGLLLVNLLVLALWSALAPIKWERFDKTEKDPIMLTTTETYGACSSDEKELTLVFAGLIAAIDILSLIFANIQAYQCRNISVEFSESQWIAIAMVSIMQVLFIGIPLMVLVWDDPPSQFYVRVGIIFITSMSTLLLIFLPKVKYNRDQIRQKKEREEQKRKRRLDAEKSEYSDYARKDSLVSESQYDDDRTTRTSQLTDAASEAEGIKIIAHPGEEDPQIRRIRDMIREAELQYNKLLSELDRTEEKKKAMERNSREDLDDDPSDVNVAGDDNVSSAENSLSH